MRFSGRVRRMAALAVACSGVRAAAGCRRWRSLRSRRPGRAGETLPGWPAAGSPAGQIVHPVHDLPHLAVESAFGITDGLLAELAAGAHGEAGRATAARDTRRAKHGRIVTGAAAGIPAAQWLTAGHRRAKTVTNCVANRFGRRPDTPRGVRDLLRRWAVCRPAAPCGSPGPSTSRPPTAGCRRADIGGLAAVCGSEGSWHRSTIAG